VRRELASLRAIQKCQKGKKMGCPQEGKGHPDIRVSMVLLYITKIVIIVNRKSHCAFSVIKVTLIFDTWAGFRYNCALMAISIKSGKFLLAICQALLYITPLVLA
jgi:hypothetical protein